MPPIPITTSADISSLDFKVQFDISGATPHIILTNQSVGPNLAGCTWWYSITTPSNTPIHTGSSTTPDMTGVWTPVTVPDTWPLFDGQIEFSSAASYSVTLNVKDSAGNIFSQTKTALITRPNGNTSSSVGNFGVADVVVEVKCDKAKLYATDKTNYTYQNLLGQSSSNSWTLAYPMDENGNVPTPLVVTNTPRAIFAIGYSSDGYQIYLNTFATYAMGDSVEIKVQYKFRKAFAVYCNIELCGLLCEVENMRKQVDASCTITETNDLKDKLLLIDTLLIECLIGISQPMCGINVPEKIELIKEIGGFDCCCVGGNGVNPNPSTGDISITLDATNGLTGLVEASGNNFIIHISGAGLLQNLQSVTTQGNTSTNDIIVQPLSGGAFSRLYQDKLITGNVGGEIFSGIGRYSSGEAFGRMWLHVVGHGTVYQKPHPLTNTYEVTWPNDQSIGIKSLMNDGGGNMFWGAAVDPSVYEVTGDANYTIPAANSIVILNSTITATRTLNFPSGATNGQVVKVISFKGSGTTVWWQFGASYLDRDGNTGYGPIIQGVSYEFVYCSGLAAGASWVLMKREGLAKSLNALASGNGATLTIQTPAGVGGTVVGGSPVPNAINGVINLTTGTGVIGGGNLLVVDFNLSANNPSNVTVVVNLQPRNPATAALYGAKQVYAIGTGRSGFRIIMGTTPLDDSTTYSWSYQVTT